MRVLIGCESSGRIRDAFIQRGHEAMSCDLLPTDQPGPHYQGDIFDVINDDWDLMIAHPPCTFLSYAGNKYLSIEKYGEKAIERLAQREKAMQFFNKLYNAPINKICIENPLGYPIKTIQYSQIIQPYFFGDRELKRTCLWLKNLPKLVHIKQDDLFSVKTHTLYPEPTYVDKSGKKRYFTDSIGGYHGSGNSFKKRSVTFHGIAYAMASQWGGSKNLN